MRWYFSIASGLCSFNELTDQNQHFPKIYIYSHLFELQLERFCSSRGTAILLSPCIEFISCRVPCVTAQWQAFLKDVEKSIKIFRTIVVGTSSTATLLLPICMSERRCCFTLAFTGLRSSSQISTLLSFFFVKWAPCTSNLHAAMSDLFQDFVSRWKVRVVVVVGRQGSAKWRILRCGSMTNILEG